MASLSFSALKSSLGKPWKSRRGSGNFDESFVESVGSWQARLREGRNFLALLTLVESSTLKEEEFFADPAAFGWVIEKGQAPSIHSMLLGVWHPLHSPARIITPAERLAFTLRKLPRMRTRRNRSAVNSYSGSAPCGVEAATKVN
jgi:hypothetical protein